MTNPGQNPANQPTPPAWGTPQPPASGKPPWSTRKKVLVGCAALFVAASVVSGISNGLKHKNTSAAAPSHPAQKPVPAPATSKPNAPASSPPAAAPTATFSFSLPPSQLAPADIRQKAAGILRANDAYYQQEFDKGVTVTLARGTAGSFDAFHAWQQKAATDVQPGIDAFKQADGLFNASNEPASISSWRDDSGTVAADVASLANDGLDVGGPDDAQARQKVQADIAQMKTDMAVAEQDAADVEAGK